jgi:hypothetical protein
MGRPRGWWTATDFVSCRGNDCNNSFGISPYVAIPPLVDHGFSIWEKGNGYGLYNTGLAKMPRPRKLL